MTPSVALPNVWPNVRVYSDAALALDHTAGIAKNAKLAGTLCKTFLRFNFLSKIIICSYFNTTVTSFGIVNSCVKFNFCITIVQILTFNNLSTGEI